MHEHHPLAGRETIDFVETLESETGWRRCEFAPFIRLCRGFGQELRFTDLASTFDAACRFIEAQEAVGVLPAEAVERYQDFYHLRAIKLTDAWAKRRMVLCVKDALSLSPAAELLLEHLRYHATDG